MFDKKGHKWVPSQSSCSECISSFWGWHKIVSLWKIGAKFWIQLKIWFDVETATEELGSAILVVYYKRYRAVIYTDDSFYYHITSKFKLIFNYLGTDNHKIPEGNTWVSTLTTKASLKDDLWYCRHQDWFIEKHSGLQFQVPTSKFQQEKMLLMSIAIRHWRRLKIFNIYDKWRN